MRPCLQLEKTSSYRTKYQPCRVPPADKNKPAENWCSIWFGLDVLREILRSNIFVDCGSRVAGPSRAMIRMSSRDVSMKLSALAKEFERGSTYNTIGGLFSFFFCMRPLPATKIASDCEIYPASTLLLYYRAPETGINKGLACHCFFIGQPMKATSPLSAVCPHVVTTSYLTPISTFHRIFVSTGCLVPIGHGGAR